jgi:hypothetical protein
MASDSIERMPAPATQETEIDRDETEYAANPLDHERHALREDGLSRQRGDFDPTPYLRQLRGRGGGEYLDVKWRLLWLRKEHPDATIVTDLVQHDPQMAIFKATVTLPTGGMATGYGSETASDFPDFIEKAETKAIGRALNALGYGAQFGDRTEEPTPMREAVRPAPPAEPIARPTPLPRQRREAFPPAPAARVEERPAQPAPSEPNPSTSAPSPAASDPELVDYSWSAFWPWARDRGLNGPREIEMLIGQAVAGLSPKELRERIEAADAQR